MARPLPTGDLMRGFQFSPRRNGLLALGRLPTGTMNKTEAAYSEHLEAKRIAGAVLWFAFEPIKLRLADNTFYSPDFGVIAADGVLEMHEVKGFWADDARVKIKVAADRFPFRFVAARPRPKNKGGGWELEDFGRVAPAGEVV